MAVDIAPLMNHPAWGSTMTPAQRKQALDLWQDPATTDEDRAQMRQVMDGWQAAAAQAPSGPERVVSSVGGMLKAVPGLAYDVAVAPFVRAGGYTPNAPPAQAPQSPQEWEARTLGMEQQATEGAKGVFSLMAGPGFGRAGYAAGEALIPTLAPRIGQTAANALPAIGEAGGNYLARQANVAAGTEQPGIVGDVASVALPLGVRAATSAPVARRLPGSAVTQHEMAADDIRRGVERMQPATPSETLYRAVAQGHNPTIDIQDLRQTARALIVTNTQRGAATRNADVLRLAREIDDLGTQYGNQVPMDVLYDRMQGTGEILGKIQSTGDRGAKETSALYAGFHRALENASQSNVPGAETLQQAIKASRQEHAVKRLAKIIGQDTGEGRGIATQDITGYTFVRGKYMLNQFERALADDDVFRGSFTADEIADMRQLFQRANELPKLPVPGSVQAGSMRVGIRGSIGGGLGYALGGPEGAAAGASAAIAAPEIIAKAMMHPLGRQYLKAALEGRGGITPQTLAVLNEVIREGGEAYTSKRPATTP